MNANYFDEVDVLMRNPVWEEALRVLNYQDEVDNAPPHAMVRYGELLTVQESFTIYPNGGCFGSISFRGPNRAERRRLARLNKRGVR